MNRKKQISGETTKKSRRWLSILAFVLVGTALFFYFFLNRQNNRLYGIKTFSCLLIGEESSLLLAWQQESQSGAVFVLPQEMMVETARRLGSYQYGAVYKLGEQQGIGGGRLARETIQQNLFIPVDSFLSIHGSPQPAVEGQRVKSYLLKQIIASLFRWHVNTDLTWLDRVKITRLLISSKSASWEVISLADYLGTNERGEQTADNNKLADRLLYAFAQREYFSLSGTWEVSNLSSCPEAGAKTIKLLLNMGLTAYDVKSKDGIAVEHSYLVLKTEQDSGYQKLINRIRYLLDIKGKDDKQGDIGDRVAGRIVIGEDYCRLIN